MIRPPPDFYQVYDAYLYLTLRWSLRNFSDRKRKRPDREILISSLALFLWFMMAINALRKSYIFNLHSVHFQMNVVISGGVNELAASAPPPLTPSAELHC
jgi:hypothetical protein